MGKIDVIGVGPGSADYVTPAARKAVQQAQLVIGAQRSLNLFTNDVKGEKIVLTAKNLNDSLKEAAQAVKSGKNVALLSTGDPGFSGLLHTAQESGFFNAEQIHVISGVSSIQACAARLNLSWDNTRLFTFHDGQVSADKKEKLLSAVQNDSTIMILPATKSFAPKDIATFLIKSGIDQETSVNICENLTLENERVTSISLEELQGQTYEPLSVMVIKQKLGALESI